MIESKTQPNAGTSGAVLQDIAGQPHNPRCEPVAYIQSWRHAHSSNRAHSPAVHLRPHTSHRALSCSTLLPRSCSTLLPPALVSPATSKSEPLCSSSTPVHPAVPAPSFVAQPLPIACCLTCNTTITAAAFLSLPSSPCPLCTFLHGPVPAHLRLHHLQHCKTQPLRSSSTSPHHRPLAALPAALMTTGPASPPRTQAAVTSASATARCHTCTQVWATTSDKRFTWAQNRYCSPHLHASVGHHQHTQGGRGSALGGAVHWAALQSGLEMIRMHRHDQASLVHQRCQSHNVTSTHPPSDARVHQQPPYHKLTRIGS